MKTLVLALNPSIDVEWNVGEVRWEEKNVVESQRRWPGGKGVNVARWLRFLNAPSELLLPLGGRNGEELSAGLRSEKLRFKSIRIAGETRANVIVSTAQGRQLRFNPHGPALTPQDRRHIENSFDTMCRRSSLVVLSGSLPRGLASSFYGQLVRRASPAQVRTLLDCDGEALTKAVQARPFLVKPNEHELSQWFGSKLSSERKLIDAAKALSEITRGWVLLSRGAKGAMLLSVAERKHFVAKSPEVVVRNTVGAGDSLLAAVASEIHLGKPPVEWLRAGVSVGTVAVQLRAGDLPSTARIQRTRERLDVAECAW